MRLIWLGTLCAGLLVCFGLVCAAANADPTVTPVVYNIGPGNLFELPSTDWIRDVSGDSGWFFGVSGDDPNGICAMFALGSDTITSEFPGQAPGSFWIKGPGTYGETSQTCTSQESYQWETSGDDWNGAYYAAPFLNTLAPAAYSDPELAGIASGQVRLTVFVSGNDPDSQAASVSGSWNVDNEPVSVSFATPNDANTTVWVDHAVTVDPTAITGPSGLSSLTCGIDAASQTRYAGAGLTVNGDGTHTVSCAAANNAIDPAGVVATGGDSLSIKIDEVPPAISFAPADPSNPDQVVVNTSDGESGVAGGSIAIAPAGSTDWTQLPTTFTGSQLIATINDAGLTGPYVVQARSCDVAGNCGTENEDVTLPLRLPAALGLSFAPIQSSAHIAYEEVRVGGQVEDVARVVNAARRCKRHRVKTGKHSWAETLVCHTKQIRLVDTKHVAHGKAAVVSGLLATQQGAPLANATVTIEAAPQNGLRQFSTLGTATTAANGVWSFQLPAGPSRIVQAIYGGSATVLPTTGTATTNVPARIVLRARPKRLAWNGVLTLRGRLVGGYVPPDGVALRLLVRYPHSVKPTPVLALRTNRKGQFKIRWSYGAGRGVATYPFTVATTASESDYPFQASSSKPVRITFGSR